jgi:phosphoglucosamine mutase
MTSPVLEEARGQAENRLGSSGRVLIRPSGTEPLLRLLVEAKDETLMNSVCHDLESVILEISTAH